VFYCWLLSDLFLLIVDSVRVILCTLVNIFTYFVVSVYMPLNKLSVTVNDVIRLPLVK